ncbi:hypothetical protein [Pelagerythrobacter marensis]|uniref:hypothetical protein n=1 Tax=Pelagerythrobacter marensis TaxID=543877 RepID=UPI0006495486|nr:hypothetical protein [Pelagerythrobacter marensis]
MAALAQNAQPQVDLEERVIRIVDIADLECSDGRTLCDRPVAIVPAETNVAILSEARRRQLLRRHFPLVQPALRHTGTVSFHTPSTDSSPPRRRCLMLRQAVRAGEYIVGEHVETAPCKEEVAMAAVRYDRDAHAVRAGTDLERGTYLGSLAVRDHRPLAAGIGLTLVARSGSVELNREVRLLQPGRPGRAAFVQTGDGEVFPVPLSGGEERQ